MDLIEQLGGYGKAKEHQKQRALNGLLHEYDFQLVDALLEYRRAHNIFEVDDLVVLREFDCHADDVLLVWYSDDLHAHLNNGEKYNLNLIRHATPEEIKAGKRL